MPPSPDVELAVEFGSEETTSDVGVLDSRLVDGPLVELSSVLELLDETLEASAASSVPEAPLPASLGMVEPVVPPPSGDALETVPPSGV